MSVGPYAFGVINKYERMSDFVQWKVGAPDESRVEVHSPFTSSFSHSAFALSSPLILMFGIHPPLSVRTLLDKSHFRYKPEEGRNNLKSNKRILRNHNNSESHFSALWASEFLFNNNFI